MSGDCLTDDEGGYSDNYAWDCNVYAAKSDTDAVLYADKCNGRERPDGTYAYYATRSFPYYLGCYTGTATARADLAAEVVLAAEVATVVLHPVERKLGKDVKYSGLLWCPELCWNRWTIEHL